ncbi:hypothetical protein Tco_1492398 [Tanacetum coccineum]
MAPRGRPTRLNPAATPTPVADPTTTTSVTSAQLQAMIDEGVTAVLAARATTRNGDDSHTSGIGVRRNERAVRECTYQDFMKCQPLFFRGTEGVVDLTQWFERMETVFRISNCTVENQVKFATCTLMGIALTWNEIKKIEAELWNLKVKGTDVVAYNQRFQELALLCDRMFPEETDKIERRNNTFAERQAENKRKFEDTPRNNQNQQISGVEGETGDKSKKKKLQDYRSSKNYPEVIFPENNKRHEEHLKIILELLKKEEFQDRIRNDLASAKRTNGDSSVYLGLAGYYRRFIEGFSKIAKPMTKLTQRRSSIGRQMSLLECFRHGKTGTTRSRVRALVMTRYAWALPNQILNAQTEARKPDNIKSEEVEVKANIIDNGFFGTDPRYLNWKWDNITIEFVTKHPKLERSTHRPEYIQETTEKIIQVKQRMQAARDRQKSYADLKHKPMEFEVGDKVMLKVSPWKGVVRFGKRGKLNPRFVGPFKKCHADEPLAVPLDGLHFDDKLQFVEEPIEITDHEVKRLKRNCIPMYQGFDGTPNRGPDFTKGTQEINSLKDKTHIFFSKTGRLKVLRL